MRVGIMHQMWAAGSVSDREVIDEALQDVKLADRLGFGAFWFGEHHFNRERAVFGRVPVPELVMARFAGETDQIHLGTGVKVLPLDSGARFAEKMALLDLLTNGRAEFGVGEGSAGHDTVEDKGERFLRELTETVAYLRAEGEERPKLSPAPAGDLTGSLWVASRTNECIALGARLGLNFVVGQAELGMQQRLFVDQYRASGGTGSARGHRMALIAESDEEALAIVEAPVRRSFEQTRKGRYYQAAVERGLIPETEPTDLRDILNRVEYLAGSPETVARGLRKYQQDSGVDEVGLMVHIPGIPREAVRRSLVLFAEEVAPRLGIAMGTPDQFSAGLRSTTSWILGGIVLAAVQTAFMTTSQAAPGGLYCDGVRMTFGKGDSAVTALNNCSLIIAPGERAAIIGPSGCGKSTLLRVLANLAEPTSGTVLVGGKTPREARLSRDYSFVFQHSVMLPWRTLRENVELAMEVTHVGRKERHERAAELINLVGLNGFENRYPKELSGGMRQRGAIARALTMSPQFLFMDEPFGALDEINRERLNFELLRILAATSATLLLVTHSISEAVILSDRVFVMTARPGRISEVVDVRLPRERTPEIRDDPQFVHCESVLRHSLYGA